MNTTQIASLFPYQQLTPIEGTPTYATLAVLQVELNANVAAIHTSLGSGKHGLLGLTLSEEEYKKYTNADWVSPTNPGETPNYAGLTEMVAVEEATGKFDANSRTWQEHNN